jgi:hypothetical protein
MSPAANAMRHAYIQHAIYNIQRTTIRSGLEGFLVCAAGNIFDSEEMVEVVTTNPPTSSFVLVFVTCSCVRAYVVLSTCFFVCVCVCVCMRMWVVVSRVCVQFVCLFVGLRSSLADSVWFILQGEVDNTLMTDELADGDGGIPPPLQPCSKHEHPQYTDGL